MSYKISKVNQKPAKWLTGVVFGLAFLAVCAPDATAQKNTVAPTVATKATLTRKQTAKELERLTQYVIDSAFLFSQAHDSLTDPANQSIREQMLSYQQSAEKEITTLSDLVRTYNGKVPTYGRDFKGFFMTGYSAIRGVTSDEGVLKALHTNLLRVVDAFDKSLEKALPADVRTSINNVRGELSGAADYVEQQINKGNV